MIVLKVRSQIHLFPIDELRPETACQIKEKLSFDNPQFIENARLGYSNYQTPREIHGYHIKENTMIMPRGFFPGLVYLLKQNGVKFQVVDNRRFLAPIHFEFQGELHTFQKTALDAIMKKDSSVLQAPTGSGKTVIALAAIAERKQPALIIVHTKELLDQWIARINEFLGIPSREIGQIGGGRFFIGKKITVGLIQSVYKRAADITPHIGHLIIDECHRCPSSIFTEAVTAFDSFFVVGLTATPYRRDQLTRLIFWYIGNKAHEIDQSALVAAGNILQADVAIRETDFFTTLDASTEYSSMLTQIAADYDRNCLIVQDVVKEANNGSGVCLILSDRKNHCDILSELLGRRGIKANVLTGEVSNGERKAIVERLNSGDINVLIATGQLIGEGFDCKSLSTLFLVMPIRFEGRLIQYLGRILRPAPGKEMAKVYDYVDQNIGVLANSARGRQRLYARKVMEAN